MGKLKRNEWDANMTKPKLNFNLNNPQNYLVKPERSLLCRPYNDRLQEAATDAMPHRRLVQWDVEYTEYSIKVPEQQQYVDGMRRGTTSDAKSCRYKLNSNIQH